MSESKSLEVQLGKRSYKIKVQAEHETMIQERVNSIQSKFNEMKTSFPGRDEHDYLAMTLIDFVSSNEMNNQSVEHEELITRLSSLNDLLDQ